MLLVKELDALEILVNHVFKIIIMYKLILLFILIYINIFSAKGQKIEVENNRIFVNCLDLPMYNECPDNIPVEYSNQNMIINTTEEYSFPAKKFEVSNYNSAYLTESWEHSRKICLSLNENGTGWRLPNQKELFLIYILRGAIENHNMIQEFNGGYYMTGLVSNNEGSGPYPQNQVHMSNGNSRSSGSSEGYYVRCVRDRF